MPVSGDDELDPVHLHERVINHLFASGLTLAGILSLQRLDAEVSKRLQDVIQELDTAVRVLRNASIARVIEDRDRQSFAGQGDVPKNWHRRLCRFSIDEVFAYAVSGYDFYRADDDMLWALERDGLLLSARSGKPLARREGKVFYDIASDVPLYYEDRRSETGASESAGNAS